MNFDYSEEECALAEQARRLLAERAPPSLIRALLEGEGRDRAAALWTEVSALGWPAIAIPEAHGGLGFGHVALCALAEEVGRAMAPLPMLPSIYLAAEAIATGGSEAQKARWLPRIALGEIVGTAIVGASVSATATGNRLTLPATLAPFGAEASIAVVAGRDGAWIVDLGQAGVVRTAVRTIDQSLPCATIAFDRVETEPLQMIDAERILARAAVLVAFEQLGGADACLDMALGYVRERRTFGRVVGSYQAVKHRLADIYVANQLARSNAYYAAWALSADAPELALAAATARVSATAAYELAARENIQLHGGIGFTWEADCHLHYRRSRVLAQILEPVETWHRRLAAALDREGVA
ncbi:acyl-CoA dehydrogenase family protein [Flavisphingomonas formosensis]|uniref:acyl-CoA dehydrogenase family protein n=1 Tax=Flavisphingomonas formosensis TaxID=861534 RepID=UPI0018DF5759|nr:acyl-CoA dehydrogenase family protein [Sphingomonas formosensis]